MGLNIRNWAQLFDHGPLYWAGTFENAHIISDWAQIFHNGPRARAFEIVLLISKWTKIFDIGPLDWALTLHIWAADNS